MEPTQRDADVTRDNAGLATQTSAGGGVATERHSAQGTPERWPGGNSSGRNEQASDMKQEVRDRARETYEQVRGFTNESLEKARQQWNETRGHATERAREVFDQQKRQLCGGIHDAAEAARAAADKLEEKQDHSVARYARLAGDGLDQVGQYLEAADVRDMTQSVSRFTRRHPEWVIGGMFLAGVAIARFLKADRHIGPRGRPPKEADDSIYSDVYRYQFEGDEGFSEFNDSSFGGARTSPGGIGGYNPSGGESAGGGYGQSYGSGMSQDTKRDDSSFAGGTGTAGGKAMGSTLGQDPRDDQKGGSI